MMNEGSFAATFLVVFREALEGSLIVGIILTLLSRLKAGRYSGYVVASAGMAILASILAGLSLSLLTGSAQGRTETLMAGSISFIACGVLTYMVFWMDAQSRSIKPHLEEKVSGAISRNDFLAMVAIPFLAVFREGAETVLFLKAVAIQGGSVVSLWGGIVGILLAVCLTSLIFVWGKRIPLQPLFRGTGFFILLIAAGLFAMGIHEFQELGLVPVLLYPVWNMNVILNENEGIGSFLKAIFGYNGAPSLMEALAYWSYLTGIFLAIRYPSTRRSSPKISDLMS